VVIADTQDNSAGGEDSNTTGMLRALVECGAQGVLEAGGQDTHEPISQNRQ
jgi:microcystin degradation protein MlrC